MNNKTILLVDDKRDMVFALKLQLEEQGFNVLVAYDGQEALDTVRKTKGIDLIILDIMLPKVDGYRVCRMLKFDRKYQGIPIIMFTARAQESDEKLGYEVGADAYITKPFDWESLLKHVKALLPDK